jgi:predicted Rossmann-fold nucleotide-binding protein
MSINPESAVHPIYAELHNIVERARAVTEERIATFMQECSLDYIVAFIGDSSTDGPLAERNTTLIDDFYRNLPKREHFAVQTGSTQGGIPELATTLAHSYGIPTIGVLPEATMPYLLDQPADLIISTPDLLFGRTSFGSETPTFINTIDGLIVIGGGYGTRVEVSTMLRVNKSRADARRRNNSLTPAPIYACPISGTGRTADELATMTLYEDAGDCLPARAITTGAEAASYIATKLG